MAERLYRRQASTYDTFDWVTVRPRKKAPSSTGFVLMGCLICQAAGGRATMLAAPCSNMTPNPLSAETAAGFRCN